jgi:hypothetical protein
LAVGSASAYQPAALRRMPSRNAVDLADERPERRAAALRVLPGRGHLRGGGRRLEGGLVVPPQLGDEVRRTVAAVRVAQREPPEAGDLLDERDVLVGVAGLERGRVGGGVVLEVKRYTGPPRAGM